MAKKYGKNPFESNEILNEEHVDYHAARGNADSPSGYSEVPGSGPSAGVKPQNAKKLPTKSSPDLLQEEQIIAKMCCCRTKKK